MVDKGKMPKATDSTETTFGLSYTDVMRDVRKMLKDMGDGGETKFGSSYLSAQNKRVDCFNLPRRECDVLVLASAAAAVPTSRKTEPNLVRSPASRFRKLGQTA